MRYFTAKESAHSRLRAIRPAPREKPLARAADPNTASPKHFLEDGANRDVEATEVAIRKIGIALRRHQDIGRLVA